MSYVAKARKQADITIEAAAAITNMSMPTYIKKEKEPWQFSLSEFCNLYKEMDEIGQELMNKELVGLGVKNFVV